MSPAAPTPRQFRIRLVDGTDLGTMTEERAVELIRQGVIERGDRVQRVGSASWRRADDVAAHVFAQLDREAGEGSFIGEADDAEPASVWPSAGAAVGSEFTSTPALQPPPRAPSAWWRRHIVPIVAIAAGIVLALAVSIPLFVSQATVRAAREFNASLVAESDSLVEGAEKGDPTSLLPQFDACLATFMSPQYPLNEQAILRRAAVESARSRLYWSTRRLEPEFAKVEALAGRATAAAETGNVPSAEALVSQARGALPRLPAPLPATIDARRAGKPLLAIEAAESAIRTAKEAEAARDRAVRLRAEQERAEVARAESARQAVDSAQRAAEAARADRARRGGILSGALERSLLPLDTVESGERPQVLVFRERSSASAVWAAKCVIFLTKSLNMSAQSITIPPHTPSSAARAKLAIGKMEAARDAMQVIARGGGATSTFLASLCDTIGADFARSMALWESWDGGSSTDAMVVRESGIRNAWDLARGWQRYTLSQIKILKPDVLVAAADIEADGSFMVSGIPPGEYVVFFGIHDRGMIGNWVKRFTVDGPGDFSLKLNRSGAMVFLNAPMVPP
jgi:hypothetical protein